MDQMMMPMPMPMPEEVIEAILSMVPVKSLLRFRSCQGFRSSPVASTNGLVCLRSTPYYDSDWIGIWNPSTKKVKELTPLTKADYCAVAFGWDPIANDHKVFRLCRSVSGGSSGWFEVWSAGSSRSWTSFQIDPMYDVLPMCSINLVMEEEGRTYCLVGRGRQHREGGIIKYRDLIACFDMVKEEVRYIHLPIHTNDSDGDSVSLIKWMGNLGLATLVENPGPACQVWRMDKDSESWTKGFLIDLTGARGVFNLATSISPTQIFLSDIGQLHLYDLETRECETIGVPSGVTIQIFYHVESLL